MSKREYARKPEGTTRLCSNGTGVRILPLQLDAEFYCFFFTPLYTVRLYKTVHNLTTYYLSLRILRFILIKRTCSATTNCIGHELFLELDESEPIFYRLAEEVKTIL